MKTIALDLMGGDKGPNEFLSAISIFLKENENIKVIAIGDKNEIEVSIKNDRFKFIHTDIQIDKNNSIRKELKKESSMKMAISLVKDKKADIVISSGDSGMYISLMTLILKRQEGVSRPAFAVMLPTFFENKKVLFMDVGANLEVRSNFLTEWASIGSNFYNKTFGTKKPKVAVLNIGTENSKGFDFHKEANDYLKNNFNDSFEYVGFIESREILKGEIDVVVTDGYAGNMVLKTVEGTSNILLQMIQNKLKNKFMWKVGGAITKGAYDSLSRDFDYRSVGAAWVIGVNGLGLKAHGNSDLKSYLSALRLANL
ncbi:MAG: phosphate acyltransferase PlsX [Mollicutes bacterium PWAP]|nr:phosphate acyltransferase PlsX [Mollicutes bacterium PWAP]